MSEMIDVILRFVQGHWILLSLTGILLLLLLIRWLGASSLNPRAHRLLPPEPAPFNRTGAKATSSRDGAVLDAGDGEARAQLTSYQSVIRKLEEDNQQLRTRLSHLAHLSSSLAPLAKELNACPDRRQMGPVLLRVLRRVFEPAQALVFFTEPDGETLTLVASHGAGEVAEGYRQPVGEGFAGLVARKKVALAKSDLTWESRTVTERVTETEPAAFATDIAHPILYRRSLLGVLALGGIEKVQTDARAILGIISDMTALALTNAMRYRKIEELAHSDALTRIHNKGHFLELAAEELHEATRDGRPMAVLMLDLDHFKHYNDTNGHMAGDRLLRGIADLLKKQVREHDLVGRFGGEEFVVLFSGLSAPGALEVAERIRSAISKTSFPGGSEQPLGRISASIGLACAPDDGWDLGALVEKADEAMYAAKKAGRDRVMVPADRVEAVSLG